MHGFQENLEGFSHSDHLSLVPRRQSLSPFLACFLLLGLATLSLLCVIMNANHRLKIGDEALARDNLVCC